MAAPICVARIGAAHGVRGAVKLWTFTEDPLAVRDYGPLMTKDGARQFEVANARPAKDHLVATFKGVTTREDAERLNGIELYVARDRFPQIKESDEFYIADLVGLQAVDKHDAVIGDVVAVHNFGAGDLIELKLPDVRDTVLLPFSDAVVPSVDIAGGKIVIEMPAEISSPEEGKE